MDSHVIVCPEFSQYLEIPIIRELIDFEGDLKCLERKHKFEKLKCFKVLGNCNTTTLNKTALMVSMEIQKTKLK